MSHSSKGSRLEECRAGLEPDLDTFTNGNDNLDEFISIKIYLDLYQVIENEVLHGIFQQLVHFPAGGTFWNNRQTQTAIIICVVPIKKPCHRVR